MMYLLLLMCISVVLNFYYESISQYRGTKNGRWSKRKTVEKLRKACHEDKNRVGTERRTFVTLPSNKHVDHLTNGASSIHFEYS